MHRRTIKVLDHWPAVLRVSFETVQIISWTKEFSVFFLCAYVCVCVWGGGDVHCTHECDVCVLCECVKLMFLCVCVCVRV